MTPSTPKTRTALLLLAGALVGIITATAISVMADGDPTTDSVPRTLPYQGVLELNGQPINAQGEQALNIQFTLFDGQASETPVYTQSMPVEVFAGRFTATIGPLGLDAQGDEVVITDIIQNADDLYLGITLLNNPETPDDDIALNNRQRIHATPYSMWTTSATNITVAQDATVGRNLNVTGHTRVGSLNVAGDVALQGPSLRLGLSGDVGAQPQQRALAHDDGDTLVVNRGTDFEGGTRIDGDVIITGRMNALGGFANGGFTVEPRYYMTNNQQGDTIDLDMERITSLCGDEDGCRIRLAAHLWDNISERAPLMRVFHMYYRDDNQRWRTDLDTEGRIGDGSREHARNIFDTCYFTEGRYINFQSLGDDGQGFRLLLWNGQTGPNRFCSVTIED